MNKFKVVETDTYSTKMGLWVRPVRCTQNGSGSSNARLLLLTNNHAILNIYGYDIAELDNDNIYIDYPLSAWSNTTKRALRACADIYSLKIISAN